jgi:hypothetical protein
MHATQFALWLLVALAPVQKLEEGAFQSYIAGHEALSADDHAKAKTALAAMARVSQGNIGKLAAAAASARDLESMRAAFKPLSEAVAKERIPAGYVVASCPMYRSGAAWVQKDGPVRNPYYGSSMLECGSIEKK